MCNCCGCSCFSLRTGEYFHTATLVRSNYISHVDPISASPAANASKSAR
jgi:hypothetical protein